MPILSLNAALNFGRVAYAVPGSPLFAEKTVEIILDKAAKVGIRCRILPAVSFLEAVSAELRLPREQEFVVVNALQPELLLQNADKHKIIIGPITAGQLLRLNCNCCSFILKTIRLLFCTGQACRAPAE